MRRPWAVALVAVAAWGACFLLMRYCEVVVTWLAGFLPALVALDIWSAAVFLLLMLGVAAISVFLGSVIEAAVNRRWPELMEPYEVPERPEVKS